MHLSCLWPWCINLPEWIGTDKSAYSCSFSDDTGRLKLEIWGDSDCQSANGDDKKAPATCDYPTANLSSGIYSFRVSPK